MENKKPINDPEKKVTEEKKPNNGIAVELDDEMLSKVAGGDSTDSSENESQNNGEKKRSRLLKPMLL